jgi:hypothetical protein
MESKDAKERNKQKYKYIKQQDSAMYCISRKYCGRYRWYYANVYCEAKRKAGAGWGRLWYCSRSTAEG